MSRIQSSVGLITGIPIEETVNKLLSVAARPRILLDSRTKQLQSEKLAVSKLSSLVLAFQFEVNRFSSASLFQTKSVASSNEDVLTATVNAGGNPAVGNYKVRALQTATSQQLVSNSFASLEDLGEEGTLSFGFGGFVDTGIALSALNSGAGVAKGKIRITDRAGNVADIDLRAAKTVDDVLRAINSNEVIEVTAVADGDRFQLNDTSGGSGNLRVQEVGGGTTAANLGLGSINVAANQANGNDVFALYSGIKLSQLNDGNGVDLRSGNDLQFSFREVGTLNVDLGGATTLGEVLTEINAADPAKLTAAISADGNRIVLTDLTSGPGTFSVSSVGGGTAAKDLGLTTTAAGDTITGRRLVSGLRDTLVSSLNGGQGVGTLGVVGIRNRNNVLSNVNLSAAETLGGVVAAINTQATGVTAKINSARNGILLTDTTGATASNLIVTNGDSNNSATALGIVASVANTTVNSGSLDRQQVSRTTLLSSLNQGKGIDLKDFRITDSDGLSATVDTNTLGSEAKTVGDIIDRINALAIDVEARINEAGDGILLIDQAGGTGKLEVKEAGGGTAAADLRLLGTGVVTQVDGQPKQAIDGTYRTSIDLSDLDEPGANVLLSSLNDGKGIDFGAFRITDSNGGSAAVVINSTAGSFNTVADVIEAINATTIGVEARINASGSGILLFDTAGGTSKLKVEELSGGTTAADLGFDNVVKTITVDGNQVQSIDGVGKFTQPADTTALGALVTRINSLQAGVSAGTIFDGNEYRLSLTVEATGAGNELLLDGQTAGLEFTEFSAAQDAVLEVGGSQVGTGIVVASNTNSFDDVVSGVSLTIVEPSDKTISIDVTSSSSNVVDVAEDFVNAYNSLRKNLDEVTAFNEEDQTTGILFGTQAALRVESDLNRVISGRFFGVGQYSSLEAVGIRINTDGQLKLDKSRLEKAFADNPEGVSNFFQHKSQGVAAKLDAVIDRLAGEEGSALSTRTDALDEQVKRNTDRIKVMDERLERERERLFNQFALLESTIAKMQQSLSALGSLQIIPPLSVGSSGR